MWFSDYVRRCHSDTWHMLWAGQLISALCKKSDTLWDDLLVHSTSCIADSPDKVGEPSITAKRIIVGNYALWEDFTPCTSEFSHNAF